VAHDRAEGVAFMTSGLAAWRNGLEQMTDADLDTVGRERVPARARPTLPLIEIVWWVNKELIFHAAEIWFVRGPVRGTPSRPLMTRAVRRRAHSNGGSSARGTGATSDANVWASHVPLVAVRRACCR
jgi:hypothetical protein